MSAPKKIHLDYETFSEANLPEVGSFRYSADKSTEILCAAMAIDREKPVVWHPNSTQDFEKYWDALEDPNVLVYAHNAQFEMAISLALMHKTWGIRCPELSRFRCTASFARRASLPAKLETLAITLGLTNLKDKRGSVLIKKFSVMQAAKKPSKKNPNGVPPTRIRPEDDPAAFAEFLAYCQQDVVVEQEVAKRLAYFDSEPNNSNYSLDAVINARGVPVNLDALRHAQSLIEEETEIVSSRFRALTGFEITQNARFLEWLHSQGAHLDNLQAETVEAFLEPFETVDAFFEQEHSDAVKALQMKQSVAYASIKKIPTMILCAGPHDNLVRGTLVAHGASTGRWTGALIQPQNFKRPTIKNSDEAYRDICKGISREMLDIVYGPPLEVISSSIRHFIDPGEGKEFLDCDYSSIESRLICWLAGQEDALEEYRQGVDRYKRMASLIYGIPENEVNKHPQRFVGKAAVLGCGYSMGAPKFRATCKKQGGYDLPIGLEEKAVSAFRAKHNMVVKYWYALERAAKKAILRKGEVVPVRNVSFLHRDIEGLSFLLLKLPSGRKLAYPRPRINDDRIVFFGHRIGVQWGDVETYGGKLAENVCQGAAADVMAHGAHNAEKDGYEIVTLIHDQCLTYFKPGQTIERLVELLTDLPSWAAGLPIAAEGGRTPFYQKG